MNYIDEYSVEYSEDRKTLIKAPKDIEGDYTINSGVTTIAKSAFNGCEKLTSIHLPSTFKKLEYAAFIGCKALNAIYYSGDLHDWLTLDWNSCFDTGYNLYFNNELVSEISIPASITAIKDNAFYWCNSLKKVNFYEDVTEIGANAFNKSGISGILTLPEGLKKLKNLSFYGCLHLTGVKLPASVTEIWFGSFSCCYNLKHIVVSPLNTKFKTAVGILYTNEGALIAIAPCASDEPLRLPDAIHKIVKDTFCYSAVPKGGLVLTKNITSVVNEAFLKVTGLRIYIPTGTINYFKKMGVPMDNVHEMFAIETAFLKGHDNISAIVNNPFRILGVYANATQKEITANARKIKRFIEVGKSIEFETDFNSILPPIVRTEEMVDAALSSLSNPQEKFKYAMFWFVNTCDADRYLLECLQTHDIDEAQKIFEDVYTWHAFINFSMMWFVWKDYPKAIAYRTDGSRFQVHNILGANICGEEFDVDEDSSAHLFIDTLLEDVRIPECRTLFKEFGRREEDNEYLDELLSTKYTKIVNDAISVAKSASRDDAQASLDAAMRLKESTQVPLEEYAQYVGDENTEYGMLADRLANQILQCSIDFYNASIDRFAVFDALELTEYALSIVKGQVKKDRCQQNLDILKKIAAKIPPREVADDDDFLSAFIGKHKNDRGTIDNAWEILEQGTPSIIHIKECLEKTEDNQDAYDRMNNYLTMVSTALVNLSLTKLIDAVNNSQGNDHSLISSAWDLMLNMENFPMDGDFKKNRFDENKKTLKKMYESDFQGLLRGVFSSRFTTPSRKIDLRTSEEVWKECKTIKEYEYYITRFPKGCHISAARTIIEKLKIEEEDRVWENAKKREDYSDYISKYPNGRYIEEAKLEQKIVEGKRDDAAFNSCKTITQFKNYLNRYSRHRAEAKRKLDELLAEDDNIWKTCKLKSEYESYIKEHPDGQYVNDAHHRITQIDQWAKGLKWLIAFEAIVAIILFLHVICSPDTASTWGWLISVIFFIVGAIIAIAKYTK